MRWWRREELRCQEVGRLLQGFLDGEMDELRARQVARHLEDCRRCGLAIETYREIRGALRRSAPPLPEDAVARLRAFGTRLATEGPQPRDEGKPGA